MKISVYGSGGADAFPQVSLSKRAATQQSVKGDKPHQDSIKAKEDFEKFVNGLKDKPVSQSLREQILYIATNVQRDPAYPISDVVVPATWIGVSEKNYQEGDRINWRFAASEMTGKPVGTASNTVAASVLLKGLSKDIESTCGISDAQEQEVFSALLQLRDTARGLMADSSASRNVKLAMSLRGPDKWSSFTNSKGSVIDFEQLAVQCGFSTREFRSKPEIAKLTEEERIPKVAAYLAEVADKKLDGMKARTSLSSTLALASAENKGEMIIASQGATAQAVRGAALSIALNGRNYNIEGDILLDRDLIIEGLILYKKGDRVEYSELAKAFGMTEAELLKGTSGFGSSQLEEIKARNVLDFLNNFDDLNSVQVYYEMALKPDFARDSGRMTELALPYLQFEKVLKDFATEEGAKNANINQKITFQADMIQGDKVLFRKGESVDWRRVAEKLGLGVGIAVGGIETFNECTLVVAGSSVPSGIQKCAGSLLSRISDDRWNYRPSELRGLIQKWKGFEGQHIYDSVAAGIGGGLKVDSSGNWSVSAGQGVDHHETISKAYAESRNILASNKALAQVKSVLAVPDPKKKEGKIADVNIVITESFTARNGKEFKTGETYKISDVYTSITGTPWVKEIDGEEVSATLNRANSLLDSQIGILSSSFTMANQKMQNAVSEFQTWISVMQGIITALGNMSKEISQGMR